MKYFVLATAALLLGACAHLSARPVGNMPVYSTERNGIGYTAADAAAYDGVTAVLMAQQEAWNRGDIDAFMEGYWKSEQLRFGSGGDVTLGWQGTIDRYKARYTDRTAMGTLGFSDLDVQVLSDQADLDVQVLSDQAAIVHGRWALERATDRPSGLFTLVFRNFGDGWVIVSDTTTSAD